MTQQRGLYNIIYLNTIIIRKERSFYDLLLVVRWLQKQFTFKLKENVKHLSNKC